MTELLGPVSTVLENEVRGSLARHSLVLWLDADRHYIDFIEQLILLRQQEELNYDVYTFRGSHLELMFELEDVTSGIEKTRALIHLPGFNEESVKDTPLFELYRAGRRFRKALQTLVADAAAGKVRPDQIDEFLSREGLTLSAADTWLDDLATKGEEGLASQLQNVSLIELVDDLLSKRQFARRLATVDFNANEGESSENDADRIAVRDRIVSLTGMEEDWFEQSLRTSFSVGEEKTPAESIAYTICSWAMCVSYVHDLKVPPRTEKLHGIPKLPKKLRSDCHELVAHLQNGSDQLRSFYEHTANETESRLIDDVGQIAAKDLGHFDTFWFEEETILEASLEALVEGEWQTAQDWSERRGDSNSFWLREDPLRRASWQLIGDAARLGLALSQAGSTLRATDSLESVVDEYCELGTAVDRAHRQLEQDRQKLWRSHIPKSAEVRACLDRMGDLWREWANSWAVGFNSVCTLQGFLPEHSRQQRNLFEDEVKPLASDQGTTAYFVVDALRYEMAQELLGAVEESAPASTKLTWRLGELPSTTEVGMNVLAPVAKDGQLHPTIKNGKIGGFANGEYRVSTPESRRRAMFERIGGRTCPKIELDEVLRLEASTLKKKIAGARLVMVHSREIDDAGEDGFGPSVFEEILHHLKSAWHLLREAGVRHFVITADHGFILIDEDRHPTQSHGGKRDPKRRHVISDRAADHAGEVRVSIRDLGYKCEDEAHLMFPESIAVFDTGRSRKGFAHGGNSLQERVIPVLTISHRALTGGSTTSYQITARKMQEVAGLHCISAKIEVVQKSFDFGSSFDIDLGLRVAEVSGIRTELCETRGGARLSSGAIVANVGQEFELFFRLSGDTRKRVQVELFQPSSASNVETCVLKERFAVSFSKEAATKPAEVPTIEIKEAWLQDLPTEPVRRVFQHLSQHGAATETEVAEMLGSPREQRRFARDFEKYAAYAPFNAHVDVVSGVKRYVREGATT